MHRFKKPLIVFYSGLAVVLLCMVLSVRAEATQYETKSIQSINQCGH